MHGGWGRAPAQAQHHNAGVVEEAAVEGVGDAPPELKRRRRRPARVAPLQLPQQRALVVCHLCVCVQVSTSREILDI